MRRTIWWLIAATKGGRARARIILALKEKPMNAHQLTDALGADYKTTKKHLDLLSENNLVTRMGEKYEVTYFLSPELESQWSTFEEILKVMRKESK